MVQERLCAGAIWAVAFGVKNDIGGHGLAPFLFGFVMAASPSC